MQYNNRIIGAVRGTIHDNYNYYQSGLASLCERRRRHKLFLYHKNVTLDQNSHNCFHFLILIAGTVLLNVTFHQIKLSCTCKSSFFPGFFPLSKTMLCQKNIREIKFISSEIKRYFFPTRSFCAPILLFWQP